MEIKHLHHFAFNTWKIKETLAFYQDIFGFQVVSKIPLDGDIVYKLGMGKDFFIEPFDCSQNPNKMQPPNCETSILGITHIGFDVEDIEQYSKLLEKHQVEFTVKLKRLEDFNCRVLFFKDPNGIEIELFEED